MWVVPIYLLLAEFWVRTVNYGPSFFPSIYGPSAKRAGHKSMKKKSKYLHEGKPTSQLIGNYYLKMTIAN